MSQILVVDDEVGIRELLSEILRDEGHEVRLAQDAAEARTQRTRQRPDLVLLDIWMPDTDGISLLKEWAVSGQLTMPVVMMSGHGTIDTAVEATRIGAFAFLEKPIALQKLLATVGQALRQQGPVQAPSLSLANLGRGAPMVQLRARLDALVTPQVPVLVTGEPGAGKALCARHLHLANTPWVALPEDLAPEALPELVATAAEGCLFVREAGELPAPLQRALLVQAERLERQHTRLLCTSSVSLADRVAEGRFDARLYQLAASVNVRVPSLREHPEDIPGLARLLLERLVESRQVPPRQLTVAALNRLRMYHWPANLTQLESVVRSLAVLATGPDIGLAEVEDALALQEPALPAPAAGLAVPAPQEAPALDLDLPLREARDAFERRYFAHHIDREGGNMSRVADRVGLERTHLYRKLKQLGIRIARRDPEPEPRLPGDNR